LSLRKNEGGPVSFKQHNTLKRFADSRKENHSEILLINEVVL